MTTEDLVAQHPELLQTVKDWAPYESIALCAGMLLCPSMHAYTFGLELLTHLIAVFSEGKTVPDPKTLEALLKSLQPQVVESEELPYDVFVVNVLTERGNKRLLTGTWQNPEYWVQHGLDSLRGASAVPALARLLNELHALLDLSEAVINRAQLSRHSRSVLVPTLDSKLPSDEELKRAIAAVKVNQSDINGEPGLTAYVTTFESARRAGADWIGNSRLEHQPILRFEEGLVFCLPTAVSAAFRMKVLTTTRNEQMLEQFSLAVRLLQENVFYNELARKGKDYDFENPFPSALVDMRQRFVEFEPGKIAHLILLHDDFEDAIRAGLTAFNTNVMRQHSAFTFHIGRSLLKLKYLRQQSGMTVVLMAGLGRGFALPPFVSTVWPLFVFHLADAVGLEWLEDNWMSKLWEVHSDINELDHRGLHIQISGDWTRILGYWRVNERVVPLDVPIPAANVTVNVDPTFTATLRADRRQIYDEHASYKPTEGAWYRISKLYGKAHFRELESLPAYGSVVHAQLGTLAGVVKTGERDWWIEVRPNSKRSDRHSVYLIWDACIQWCARLLPLLNEYVYSVSGNIEITIHGDFVSPSEIADLEDTGSPDEIASYEIDPVTQVIRVNLRRPFFLFLARAKNTSEASLLRKLAEATLKLAGMNASAVERAVAGILQTVVVNDTARFIHYFRAESARDSLAEIATERPMFILNQNLYKANWGIGAELGIKDHRVLTDVQAIQAFLHTAVDIFWERIKQRLKLYNREFLIKTVLENIEAIRTEADRWRRTSAALESVYSDRTDVLSAAHEQQGDRARTTLGSRVLVEMAICECPQTGGLRLGRSDYLDLLGCCLLLITTAHNSDAIKYGLVNSSLEVWPNGEYRLPDDFNDNVIRPYQHGHFEHQFESAVAGYSRQFVERKTKPVEELFESEFLLAWVQEFGFEIADLVDFEQILMEIALERDSRIVKITSEELLDKLSSRGMNTSKCNRLLQELTLTPRDHWDAPSRGFTRRDIEPWKFARRLSLMRRPLISLDLSGNEIVFSAGMAHDAFAYTVGSSYSGTLDQRSFESAAMKRWIGTVGDRSGHKFNQTICNLMRSLGFKTRDSVSMSEFGVPELGDIDVLAWSVTGTRVLVIECKHLRFARTTGEIGEQLRRFTGAPGDELDKHLKRVEWVERHKSKVGKHLNIAESFTTYHHLVTNTLVPMAFWASLPIERTLISTEAQLPSLISSMYSS
jgi:hypothetical protein